MAYNLRMGTAGLRIGGSVGSSGGRANVPLNAAYVHRTSGPVVGFRIRALTAEPINEIYIFLDATTGTRANVTMQADLYNYGSSTQPGTTLLASSDVASLPASDDKWVRFVFSTPYTPAVDEFLFVVFYNLAAVPTTDFPSIMVDSNASLDTIQGHTRGYSSTTGFSTAGTDRGELPHVIVQGTSTIYGMPVGTLGTISTFNGRRGILLSDEIKKYKISFFRTNTATTNLDKFQIFDLSEPPTGVPLYEQTLTTPEKIIGHVLVNLDCSTLPGSGPYVFCLSTSSSASQGGPGLIEAYADYPAIFDAFSLDNFSNPATVTQSGSSWVVDRSRLYGGIVIDIEELIIPAGGSTPQPRLRGYAF